MKLLLLAFIITLNVSMEVSEETDTRTLKVDDTDYSKIKRNDLMKERDNLTTLLKTLHYSCIVLARFQISTYGSSLMTLLEKFKSEDDQNKLWKSIYIGHVLKCQKTITYEDSVKIFTQIKSNEFDLSQYEEVYSNYHLQQFQEVEPNSIIFTKEDNKTWKYIEDFEKSMKDKKEQEEDDDLLTKAKKLSQSKLELEPKVFGFQLKFSNNTSLMALLLVFLGIGGLFFILFKRINGQQPKNKNKKKI